MIQRVRALAILAILAGVMSCSLFEDEGERLPNRPPEIWLTSGPPEGGLFNSYRVHFYWHGHDPDGPVDHYRYLMTDDEETGALVIDDTIYEQLSALGYQWIDTEATNGVFIVSADELPDSANTPTDSLLYYDGHFRFHAQHSFFVSAVDDRGAVSSTPAHRTFTATTIAPEVLIAHPEDAGQPGGYDHYAPDVFFRWVGIDSVGDGSVIEPDSTRFAFFERDFFEEEPAATGILLDWADSLWSKWRHWDETDSSGEIGGRHLLLKGLTPFEDYLLFVQAKDEAGAVTSHYEDGKNLRKFQVVSSLQPMIIFNFSTYGPRITDHDQTYEFTVAENQQISQSWVGSADHYGSEITGYRFGWDIADPDNDEQWSDWSLAHVSSQASFPSDRHDFYLECMDYSGNRTRVTVACWVIPFSMEEDLLFVDDYDNSASDDINFTWPSGPMQSWGTFYLTDEMQRDAWEEILADYPGYFPARDFFRVTVADQTLPVELLANYQRVIWEVKEDGPGQSGLARYAKFVDAYAVDNPPTDYISMWMDRGGQLLLCGHTPILALLPLAGEMGVEDYERKLPVIFSQHLAYSQGSPNESMAAVQRFLPWRRFGIDAAVRPVDQTPRWVPAASEQDFPTYRSNWGMLGAGYGGESTDEYGNVAGWMSGDTLRFRPEVYEWFEDAGSTFCMEECCEGFWGLAGVEIYNWDWLQEAYTPPPVYRLDDYLPLLSYIPSDSSTRWGSDPAEEHCWQTDGAESHCEACYATGGEGRHLIAVVGRQDPLRPSVLMGFTPFYLEESAARGLFDHILLDIMDMPR